MANQMPGPLPSTWFVPSVLSLVFCFTPLVIFAMLSSAKVEKRYRAGDFEGAVAASKRARLFVILNLLVVIALAIGVLVYISNEMSKTA